MPSIHIIMRMRKRGADEGLSFDEQTRNDALTTTRLTDTADWTSIWSFIHCVCVGFAVALVTRNVRLHLLRVLEANRTQYKASSESVSRREEFEFCSSLLDFMLYSSYILCLSYFLLTLGFSCVVSCCILPPRSSPSLQHSFQTSSWRLKAASALFLFPSLSTSSFSLFPSLYLSCAASAL